MATVSPRRQPASKLISVPKLKDSCSACAASKVKCNKEKPTCARCRRRGFSCEYEGSKRTGRVSHAAFRAAQEQARGHWPTSTDGSSASASSSMHEQSGGNAMLTDTPMLSPNMTESVNSMAEAAFPPDLWNTFFEPGVGPTPAPAMDALLTTDVNEFFASLNADPSMELPINMDYSGDMDMDITEVNNSPEPMSAMHQTFELEPTSDWQQDLSFPSTPNDRPQVQPTPTPNCNQCLTIVMGLLFQLYQNEMSICAIFGGSLRDVNGAPTVESIIQENRHIIQKTSKAIECACSHDGYLLTTIALVIFKILDWYSAAARDPCIVARTPARPDAAGIDLYQIPPVPGPGGPGRRAARMVLKEFHLVQKIVNLYSCRLEAVRLRNHARRSRSTDSADSHISSEVDNDFGASIDEPAMSTASFDHLENDLRRRLRAVSFEAIDVLRRE